MKAKIVVQVRLQSPDKDGSVSERTCLIDNAAVKKGSKVTLKNSEDPKRRWKVVYVSEGIMGSSVHADWHVGGM